MSLSNWASENMYSDPTFNAVYSIQCREIKKKRGCAKCLNRGNYLAFGKYECKLKCKVNKYGYCKKWVYDEG